MAREFHIPAEAAAYNSNPARYVGERVLGCSQEMREIRFAKFRDGERER